jgi:SAM-dependent methyltransferase
VPESAERAAQEAAELERARVETLRFFDGVKRLEPSDSPWFRAALLDLYRQPRLDLSDLVECTVSALRCLAPFRRLLELAERRDTLAIEFALAHSEARAELDQPLFHQLLRKSLVNHLGVELLVSVLRRRLLAAVATGDLVSDAEQRLVVSLACQAFLNEYVVDAGSADLEYLRAIKSQLEQRLTGGDHHELSVLVTTTAMYEEAADLAPRETLLTLAARAEAGEAADFFEMAVTWGEQERRLRDSFPSIGIVAGATVEAVRAQYEASPYPRWRDATIRKAVSFSAEMRNWFPGLADVSDAHPVRILVAGCGTGFHPIVTAAGYEGAEVTAIDISHASLAYAARQAVRHGIANIRFVHGDLLRAGQLGEEFDIAEAVGVLHHMPDPGAGLRALASVVRPGGFLNLGVYSRRGRLKLVPAARVVEAWCAREDDLATLRAARAHLIESGREEWLEASQSIDFYCTSGFRDLLAHTHEILYTPRDLSALIGSAGLELLGFRNVKAGSRSAYLAEHPDDPALRNLDWLDDFDATHPDFFGGLMCFWLRRPSA